MQRALSFARLSLVFIFLFSVVCSAEEFTVSNSADLKSAIARAGAGDEIVMKNGVWRDIEIDFYGLGRKGKPITLRAESSGQVIISGRSNLTLAGKHLVVKGLVFKNGYTPSASVISFRRSEPGDGPITQYVAFHSRITQVVIDAFNNPERFETDYWVSIYGQHNRIDHSHFSGKKNRGMLMAVHLNHEHDRNNHHRIDHNYFGPRQVLGANGGETIRVGTSHYSLSDSRTQITDNYFDRCNGELEIISIKSGNNLVARNTIFESQGTLTLRHGNNNTVEDNVILGNMVPHTGGIRVINKGNVIRRNYLEGILGYRFGGAFVVMNGVPNSPLTRYHQVDNAAIVDNTFIDVAFIEFGAGSDSERSEVPVNSVFNGNMIAGKQTSVTVAQHDDLSGIAFKNNIIERVRLPESMASGFKTGKISIDKYEDKIIVKTKGQTKEYRVTPKGDTGVAWYAKPDKLVPNKAGNVYYAQPGVNTIGPVLDSMADGDVLMLKAGTFINTHTLLIRKRISIKAESKLESKLVFSRKSLFEIGESGDLTLDGLHISGASAPDDTGNAVVSISKFPFLNNYNLAIKNSKIIDLDVNRSFHVVDAATSTLANHIKIVNSEFKNISGSVLKLDKEQEDYGIYNADWVEITDSHFTDIKGAVIDLYRGGTDESTFGPHFLMQGSSLYNVGTFKKNPYQASVYLHGVQVTEVINNNFIDSAPIKVVHTVADPKTKIKQNTFKNTGQPILIELHDKSIFPVEILDNKIF